MTNKLRNDIHKFILDWNKKFPIDLWWRKKYSIPFGSKKHKNITFIEMFIDYEEDKLMNNLYNSDLPEEDEFSNNKMSESEVDEVFENLDLSKYNTKK